MQLTVDKIDVIKSKLKAVQDRQKSYADQHRKEIEFQVGEKGVLKSISVARYYAIWEQG